MGTSHPPAWPPRVLGLKSTDLIYILQLIYHWSFFDATVSGIIFKISFSDCGYYLEIQVTLFIKLLSYNITKIILVLVIFLWIS